MNFYLLQRVAKHTAYDESGGFVVLANDEAEARQLASSWHGDEGKDTWLSQASSTCEAISTYGEPRIVLRDFNPG